MHASKLSNDHEFQTTFLLWKRLRRSAQGRWSDAEFKPATTSARDMVIWRAVSQVFEQAGMLAPTFYLHFKMP